MASGVAWACAVWMPVERTVPPVRDEWIGTQRIRGPGYSGTTVLTARGFEDGPMEWARTGESSFRAGWPLAMYRSRVVPRSSLSGFELPIGELLRRGYPTDRLPGWLRAEPNRRVPIEPVWAGFAGNVVFWGALIFGVRAAARSGVRAMRRRVGRCVCCGYCIGDGARSCPECGLDGEPDHTAERARAATRTSSSP